MDLSIDRYRSQTIAFLAWIDVSDHFRSQSTAATSRLGWENGELAAAPLRCPEGAFYGEANAFGMVTSNGMRLSVGIGRQGPDSARHPHDGGRQVLARPAKLVSSTSRPS